MDSANRPTAVYRFWSHGGTLLYVGMTWDPPARFGNHEQMQAWWHKVRRVDLEWFDDRISAERAEAEAIRGEQPAENTTIPAPGSRPRLAAGRDRFAPNEQVAARVAEVVRLYREQQRLEAEYREKLAAVHEQDGVPVAYLAEQLGIKSRKSVYRHLGRSMT